MNKIIHPDESFQETASERSLLKVAVAAIALGFGFAAASIQSLSRDASGLAFHPSAATLLAFALGTGAGALLYKVVASHSKSLQRFSMILLVLAGLGGFLYPLRFISADRLNDVIFGLVNAATLLSMVGFMLYRIGKFLQHDSDEMALAEKSQSQRNS